MLNELQANAVHDFCKCLIQDGSELEVVQTALVDYLGNLKGDHGQDITKTETIEYGGRSVVIKRLDREREAIIAVEHFLDVLAGARINPEDPSSPRIMPPQSYMGSVLTIEKTVLDFVDDISKIKRTLKLDFELASYEFRYNGNYHFWLRQLGEQLPENLMVVRFLRISTENRDLVRFTIMPKDRALELKESFDKICYFLNLKKVFYIFDMKNNTPLKNPDLNPGEDPSQNYDPGLRPIGSVEIEEEIKAAQAEQEALLRAQSQIENHGKNAARYQTRVKDLLRVRDNVLNRPHSLLNEPDAEKYQPRARDLLHPDNNETEQPRTRSMLTSKNIEKGQPRARNLLASNDIEKDQPRARNLLESADIEQDQPRARNLLDSPDIEKDQPRARNLLEDAANTPAPQSPQDSAAEAPVKKAKKEVELPTLLPEDDFDNFN